MNQVASTLSWVVAMIIGVPFGMQVEAEVCSTNGCPMANTRTDPTNHCPVTQGTGAPDTLKGQPAMT